jgi:hypothetical protein
MRSLGALSHTFRAIDYDEPAGSHAAAIPV